MAKDKKNIKIVVDYNDTEIAKGLSSIIKGSYSKEFIKLLTPLICDNEQAVMHFMKIFTGYELEEPIPANTMAYVELPNLGWGVDKETMHSEKLVKEDGTVLVRIDRHIGYHTLHNYEVSYVSKNEVDPITKELKPVRKTTNVMRKDLMLFEEF